MSIPQYLLNLAGEYRVCSELNKRGVFATVTYGHRKGADVYAIGDRQGRALKIEVKTTQKQKFVTRIAQKGLADDPHAPDFWVLFQIQPDQNGGFNERFFILTHEEICTIQASRNRAYAEKYLVRRGKPPDHSTGVDNVTVKNVEAHENKWSKIVDRLGGPEESQ